MPTVRAKSGKGHTKIGIFDARGAGDAILFLQVASIVKKNYPHLQIRLENRGAFHSLYRGHPDLSQDIKPTAWIRNIDYKMGVDYLSGLNFPQSVAKLYIEPWLDMPLTDLSAPLKIYLRGTEMLHPYRGKPYSIWYSGSKNDCTVKHMFPPLLNDVIRKCRDKGVGGDFLQFGSPHDNHPRLEGTVDRREVVAPRVLANWFAHADFVVCGPSMPLWMAEAMQTRAFILAGGREGKSYLQCYHNTVYDIRTLPCSKDPCDRYTTKPLGVGWLDAKPCLMPVKTDVGWYPQCQLMYDSEAIASDIYAHWTGKIPLPIA